MDLTRARHGQRARTDCGPLPAASWTNSIASGRWRNWASRLATASNVCGGTAWASIVFALMSSIVYAFAGRMVMRTKLRSQTTTKPRSRHRRPSPLVTRRLPMNRPPTHPGEMLLEEFLKPLGVSPAPFAVRLGIPLSRLNEIIRGKRGVTPDLALRLARVLGMSADFWLGLQQDWDLWHALRSEEAEAIARLEPLRRVG